MFTEIRDYPAVAPSLHDFIVRICDCKMAYQNLYTPGSQVQRKCKRKGRSHVHAFFTLRLNCPSLDVWRANQCVNARAIGLVFPFVGRFVSLRFNFRCVCAEAGTDYWLYFTFNLHVSFIQKKATSSFFFLFQYLKTWLWYPDMPTVLRWSWYFYTTRLTNKNMKQRKKRFNEIMPFGKKGKVLFKSKRLNLLRYILEAIIRWGHFNTKVSITDLSKN